MFDSHNFLGRLHLSNLSAAVDLHLAGDRSSDGIFPTLWHLGGICLPFGKGTVCEELEKIFPS